MAGAVQTNWRLKLRQLRDAESHALVAKGVTLAEYDTLADDEPACELIEGDLFVSPAPYWGHQRIQMRILKPLLQYVESKGLGELLVAPSGVRLGRDSEVQPDILYITKTHSAFRRNVAYATEPPELVIEIVSPGSVKHDRVTKFAYYAKHCVKNYWIADLRTASIEAFVLGNQGYDLVRRGAGQELFSAPPFEDLSIDLAQVFLPEDI